MQQIGVKLLFCFIVGIISLGNCLFDDDSEYCRYVKNQRICYIRASTQNLNWADAFQICKENFTLPVIRDAEEQINLEGYLNHLEQGKVNISDIWLSGRFVKFNNWTWINGQATDVDLETGDSPFNFQKTHAAVTSYSSYYTDKITFIQRSPVIGVSYSYICQFDGECENGTGYQLTNSCLIASDKTENWHNARIDCIFRGGDLAILLDQDLQMLGKYKVESYELRSGFWIGLRRGMWTWVISSKGSEEIRYLNWRDDNKFYTEHFSQGRYYDERREEKQEEECLSVRLYYKKWEPSPCARKMTVICQRRGGLSAEDNGEQWYLGKGAFTILMIIVAVLLCVTIGVIVWLVVTKKTAVNERQLSPDRQYQDIQKQHHVYSDPEDTDHYDAIELGDAGYQDLETAGTNDELDTTDDNDTTNHERESVIE